MLVVALCLVNVSLAQDQALELLTDTGDGEVPQATIPTETVQVARPGAIPELDNYDPGRYQRVAGQRSSLVYSFEETVSRVTLVLYFHEDTDEQVTLVEGDAVQTPVTSRGTQARISDAENDCEDSAVRNRGPIEVCRLRTTTWFRVTVSNPLASCSKEVTVRLEGAWSVPFACSSTSFLHHVQAPTRARHLALQEAAPRLLPSATSSSMVLTLSARQGLPGFQ